MLTTTATVRVEVLIDGEAFDIDEALYQVRRRADLVRALERRARSVHARALELLLRLEREAA
jgi:hypothetical protein